MKKLVNISKILYFVQLFVSDLSLLLKKSLNLLIVNKTRDRFWGKLQSLARLFYPSITLR